MSDSREEMRAAAEALMYADLALDSALQYPDFDCDNQDEPRPLCSLLTQAREKLDAALSLLRAALEAREEPVALKDGVPNAEEAIGYAFNRWGYRQGTKECIAFYRGACWLQLAASPAAATQGDAQDAAMWRWLVSQHNTINPIAQVVWKRNSKPNGQWVNLIDGHDLIAHVERAAIGAESEQATEDGRHG